jgi:transposase InsO family protein
VLPADFKLRVVQEAMRGTPHEMVARVFGVSTAAVSKWNTLFRRHGMPGLENKGRGKAKGSATPAKTVARERVVALRQENEAWGTRRIRDVLKRFEALGVSETEVRRILHEEGLMPERPEPDGPREHPPRRFERAAPNQLWQSDIFTFLHRRQERLYICVFMDDHSRFVVGHALAHHQKSALVLEAFERGIAAYGNPAEVLTDNGRQYTVWRGKTEFEELLRRHGIAHIKSRPQHPQTLGKVERFWKTLWDEFLSRTVFADYADAQRRLEHYLAHYNFRRTHQALDGLVPADRFFRAAQSVRETVERQVADNALRLALEQPPRKPFYMVGQLGDQHLTIAAGAAGLQVRLGDATQTIPLQEDHGPETSRRIIAPTIAPAAVASDPEVARRGPGPRRDREDADAPGPVGAVGREAGDGGDRGAVDLARLLLPAGDAGPERDARGADAGLGRRLEHGRVELDEADRTARAADRAGGAGAAARRAHALPDAEADQAGAGEDGGGAAAEDSGLDQRWAQTFAWLEDEADGDDAGDEAARAGFDPDAGWRERGPLRWERKLAGADAIGDDAGEEDDDDGEAEAVHGGADFAGGRRATAPLRDDLDGPERPADGVAGGADPGDAAEPLPDAPAPSAGGDAGWHRAEAAGPAAEAGAGGGARGGGGEAASAGRDAGGAWRDDRSATDGGGWGGIGADEVEWTDPEAEDRRSGGITSSGDARGGADDA